MVNAAIRCVNNQRLSTHCSAHTCVTRPREGFQIGSSGEINPWLTITLLMPLDCKSCTQLLTLRHEFCQSCETKQCSVSICFYPTHQRQNELSLFLLQDRGEKSALDRSNKQENAAFLVLFFVLVWFGFLLDSYTTKHC